jgi:arachidonate 15-lipoxygenase
MSLFPSLNLPHLRWTARKAFWDALAVAKFAANRPAKIPVPRPSARVLRAVSLAQVEPTIAVPSVLVGDHVPEDEAQPLKRAFYDVQVALYGRLSPMQAGLPPVRDPSERSLLQAYGHLHRRLFPLPQRPAEYGAVPDLERLAVASPYAHCLRSTGQGHFEWSFQELGAFEQHPGLRSLGLRVDFALDAATRRLAVDHIECELGHIRPGQAQYGAALELALCAATTHTSLVRHFGGVHLYAGGPFAIASRRALGSDHPLLRLLWPHLFGTQYSNEIVTRGQMAPGGDFESIFSFTHAGMCALFEASHHRYDIGVLDPESDARRRGVLGAGFDTPALANQMQLFEVMNAHTERYLELYYPSDAALGADRELQRWLDELERLIPNGVRVITGGPSPGRTRLARLVAAFIYLATVEHEVVGTGLWSYQLWTDVQPVRVSRNGTREPLDVYQRLVNANFNLNVRRAQLMQDFSYLALDPRGADAMRTFQRELRELQRALDSEPPALWKLSPRMLEANMNA